jgi:hypothetical protein
MHPYLEERCIPVRLLLGRLTDVRSARFDMEVGIVPQSLHRSKDNKSLNIKT